MTDAETTVLYALSTLAQTCAALAAFVGAVGIYRLQFLRADQNALERDVRGLAAQMSLVGADVAALVPFDLVIERRPGVHAVARRHDRADCRCPQAPERTRLLLALSLLISAATAHAECAWVLWQETTGIGAGESESWTTIDAKTTESACRGSLLAQMESHSRDKNFVVSNNIALFSKAPSTVQLRYVCLPDTVDPRGERGTGR